MIDFIQDKIWFNVKCGAENFVLISVYSCFYVVIKIIFSSGYAQTSIIEQDLSYVISNFVMKDIFVEQFFVLINPV